MPPSVPESELVGVLSLPELSLSGVGTGVVMGSAGESSPPCPLEPESPPPSDSVPLPLLSPDPDVSPEPLLRSPLRSSPEPDPEPREPEPLWWSPEPFVSSEPLRW